MKALLLSASDIEGGAACAAYRLHRGLQAVGVDSQMLVQTKHSDDSTVLGPLMKLAKGIAKLKPTLDSLPLQFWRNRDRTAYSIQWLPSTVSPRAVNPYSDIINLHWVCEGYLQVEAIARLGKPLVWTLHDMWPFTGGCHYSQGCDRYTNSCGACPQLRSSKNWDASRWVWQRKAKAWKDLDLTIVTPSSWLADCASKSSLFQGLRIEVIPNGLDSERYKPVNRHIARELLNLPQDQYLVLFGAMNATSDPRKGFHLLQPALKKLNNLDWQDKIELVIFGSSGPNIQSDICFKPHYLGKLSDDVSLALVYAAADVFVAPSRQDNLPNTVMEALACGTPCVAFNIGGMPDMIEHQQNGYLAQPFGIEDLAQGIAWVLEDRERHQKLCDRAREKVEQEFTQDLQARRYLSLFKELVNRT
jgi:glycosyltransferase involved in cell wall biosynthesis